MAFLPICMPEKPIDKIEIGEREIMGNQKQREIRVANKDVI